MRGAGATVVVTAVPAKEFAGDAASGSAPDRATRHPHRDSCGVSPRPGGFERSASLPRHRLGRRRRGCHRDSDRGHNSQCREQRHAQPSLSHHDPPTGPVMASPPCLGSRRLCELTTVSTGAPWLSRLPAIAQHFADQASTCPSCSAPRQTSACIQGRGAIQRRDLPWRGPGQPQGRPCRARHGKVSRRAL
jgi:hypothetical protein